ncbi:DNA-binding LacI/PurR family transcriptional regulator [Actinoplanes campanulatus]|uniref:DNA-binding LacI/PurR family transcriptional regulator n=1 Tax=Actinoplanes campanulatus TaxID=113559 RepID=A0A7W5AG87_9ACTN|nr:LacI family DNA-binding transcriptional regulator [Actinoplanes campanulatus]MBB3095762.1 DNA-binding LacI/PurR family transcriptional regulator [Actinoplanes campanulatus]GGN11346.1 transcriptional regulator [Actinoplanes campanulatus]GID36659.1 transcriptional regulator [Actinoplanes campanulatus]
MSSPVPSRPPTLDEVAERAQVSRTVASRVINNGPNVSRAKRDAVEQAIRDLGFTPNRAARALATRQTGVVVLAVSGDGPGVFADPFFGQIMMGASTALEKTDLHLVLSLATTGHGQRRLESFLQTRGADGVMLVALRGDDPLIDIAARSGLPTVFIGLPMHGTPPFYVEADNAGGARAATEYLLRAGRRRIAMITGPDDTAVGRERRRGYTEAHMLAGLRPYATAPGNFMEAGGAAAMRALLSEHPDLDAVLAANDNMAAGALWVLRDAGRTVPDDVAVVGFDDLPIALHTDPKLTTIHQPVQALGREAARMLIELLDGTQPEPFILPTKVIVRESA